MDKQIPIDQRKVDQVTHGLQDFLVELVEIFMKKRGIAKVADMADLCCLNRATMYNILQKDHAKRKNPRLKTVVAVFMAMEIDLLLKVKEEGNG